MSEAHEVYYKELILAEKGVPLWNPQPTLHGEVRPGDVGYIRQGAFHRLFNVFKAEDDAENMGLRMPPHFERLVLPSGAIAHDPRALESSTICSVTVTANEIPSKVPNPSPFQRRFAVESFGHGALLYIDEFAEREAVSDRLDSELTKYMSRFFQDWITLANDELQLELKSEDLLFVNGCIKAKVWTTLTFCKEHHTYSGTLSFDYGPEWIPDPTPWSDEEVTRPVMRSGPLPPLQGPGSEDFNYDNRPRDQSIFLTGFQMKSRLFLGPKVIRAAAGPRNDSSRGPDSDMGKVTSFPSHQVKQTGVHIEGMTSVQKASGVDTAYNCAPEVFFETRTPIFIGKMSEASRRSDVLAF